MTICVPFWTGDRDQALRLLNWIKELGGTQFPIMLLASQEAHPEEFLPLAKECNPGSFLEYDYENIKTDWHTSGAAGRSAQGPNSLFRQCAYHFHDVTGRGNGKGPWLYLEPDSVPIRAGWDRDLFEEYQKCGKPFLGANVPGGDAYPEHMSGVAVWPQNTPELAEGCMRCERGAFDVVGAQDVVPKAAFTASIVHKFRHEGFKTQEEVDRWIKSDTLIFHANKDGSLIPFLRAKMIGVKGLTVTRVVQLEERPSPERDVEGSNPSSRANVVRTYYEKLEGRNHAEQEWLLATWADSWRKHGWHPVVMDSKLAKTHPYYDHFLRNYVDLPSVNDKAYELACYVRHIAMVQAGGGLLVDYDVINVGFTPEMLPQSNGKYPAILADKNPCPCGVYGTAEEYDSLCSFFAKQGKEAIVSEGGRPHTSDQHFVQHFAAHFNSYELIWQYGQKGWETAKLIHFSSGSCQGRPRSEVIPPAIEFIETQPTVIIKEALDKRNGHKQSWIGEVRDLCNRLKDMGDSNIRKQQISSELRKRFQFNVPKKKRGVRMKKSPNRTPVSSGS